MKLTKPSLICILLFATSVSWAQDKTNAKPMSSDAKILYDKVILQEIENDRIERLQSEAYISTEWMPNSGVKLLGTKSTYVIWKKFSESKKCEIPYLDITKTNLIGAVGPFVLFQTEKLNLFVYEYHMSSEPGVHWVICDRETKETLFNSYSGTPIELYFDSTSPKDEIFGGCPAPVSKVRFRKYTKTGPQLLEILSHRCQCEPNYHETLFHIDTEFKEVPGSRVDMDYEKHPERSWRWWYYGASYKPRKLNFDEHGDANWTRKLYKLPYKNNVRYAPRYKFSALVERTCIYDSAHREVKCTEKEIKH